MAIFKSMIHLLKIRLHLSKLHRLGILLALGLLALSLGVCLADENRGDWFTKKCPSLEKIRVNHFSAAGETRAQVIKKINQALHKSSPTTKIEILFVPPDASSGIDEAKYARLIHIDVHDDSVADLLRFMAMFDVEWKIEGNKVVGAQERSE